MIEFTPEQEAEIQKRINDARAEQQAIEQYRISADQFYRTALDNTALMVQRGVMDKFVLDVGKEQYTIFLQQYFPQRAPASDQKPAGADDEESQS
jgi:hypothetical protein